ncbi:hypothetical protein, partial [Streptomyces sp. NPDC015350]|uniref:hypothetical protein n=1 Tax=Streptomyces sp. NPDC015350 TaxID=3364955 RepID=UPI003700FBE8
MRKYLEQANELAGGTTSKYLELVKKLKEEEAAIRRDIKLSTHGQDYAIGLLKKDFQEELISLSKQVKRDYLYKLEQAKKEAEKVLINPVKKADEQTMSKYTQQVNELKAKVMLAIRPEAAVKLVTEFVDGITDPYVASQFR